MSKDLLDIIADKVLIGDGCWTWTGAATDQNYGHLLAPLPNRKRLYAHRTMYELLVGPIPTGLYLDHMCHNADLACKGGQTCPHRRCVRPDHLDPATPSQNVRRGRMGGRTHCAQGHERTPENTYIRSNGKRMCRVCSSARSKKWYQEHDREDRTGAKSGTHCKRGHLMEGANVRWRGARRICFACQQGWSRTSYLRRTGQTD